MLVRRSKRGEWKVTLKSGFFGLALVAALGLPGCSQSSGPVFGEWQGAPHGATPSSPVAVDLVLGGEPDATSGDYHITMTQQNPNLLSNNGTQQWGGSWTSRPGQVDGQAAKFITLHDHLPSEIGGYALTADGRLHALDPNGSLDTTPAGALYTLSPVRPRGVN